MTTTNNWPDKPGVPLNPEKDGWHWVKIIHGISHPRPRLWWSKIDRWELSDGALISPSEFAERWRYLGPVLTPDEAAALQVRADRNAAGFARVDAESERAKFLHKREIAALQKRCEEAERTALQAAECHARETRRADALQKRVAELESALKDAAASVKEWGAYASQYLQDKWDLPGEVARYIAIAEGKNDAALTGGKDE